MTQTTASPQTTTVPVAPGLAPAAIRAVLNPAARVSPRLTGRMALEIWRRPGRPIPVHRTERAVHDAARTEPVEHDGTRVATYAWGDGRRPVLLVHGWGGRASRFAPVVAALLGAGFSPVAYDAWGHGATPGPVRTILDHRQVIGALEQRHGGFEAVVAHSFGVPVAWHAVADGLAADRVVAISGMGDFGDLVGSFCAQLGLDRPVDRALRAAIERRWFDGDAGIWERFSPHRLPGREVLVVHDTSDRVVLRGQADLLLAAQGERARLLETTGLGHYRILRDPAVVGAAVAFVTGEPT